MWKDIAYIAGVHTQVDEFHEAVAAEMKLTTSVECFTEKGSSIEENLQNDNQSIDVRSAMLDEKIKGSLAQKYFQNCRLPHSPVS